ncbi:CblZ, a non-orthologous displasment for Alpha-ribazole-5'-phosphate phosphatase [Arthrobacter rhombi]|uniref:CblZ, a non-orthologous displasment for Alpha-ribazole-5'-phosphate phosphatase n=2 Tax=Micrococcales TaxID=85006 RepID=A0A1R4GV19_9MICC|nr:CblZ, a non-orthologous displasment for Alpha-ribazole-5'-phosphate phosphatase [Arthrobacter rhombi]
MRLANETGDERYLSTRDKGPQKRFARNFVDSRWMVGEFLMIIILVFLIISFSMSKNLQVTAYVTFGLWIVLAITVLDSFIMTRQLKKRLTDKFGSRDRGVLWYAAMRGLQFRKLRLPKPQIARGAPVD